MIIEHSGVKGMRWGVRKSNNSGSNSGENSNKNYKKAAIILGSAAAVAAIAVGAVYAKKHFNVPVSDIPKSSDVGKKFAEAVSKEPVGIIHGARGKNKGFTFPFRGGLDDPLKEFDKSGVHDLEVNTFKRYGDKAEKIAAKFVDPEGRHDFAGRPIDHMVMLPESLASGITKFDDIPKKVWPLIKDTYASLYDQNPT